MKFRAATNRQTHGVSEIYWSLTPVRRCEKDPAVCNLDEGSEDALARLMPLNRELSYHPDSPESTANLKP